MPVNKDTEFNIEICTTVEALHKRHADYDMILAVEDFINEGVFVLEDGVTTDVQSIRIEHDENKSPVIRDLSIQLLAAWTLVTDKRNILIHCKNGEYAAALALFVLASKLGRGREDRAVAELFVLKPDAACDETLVGLFDDYLERDGDLCDAWANGVFSTGLNPFRLLLASTRSWMDSNEFKKLKAV